MKIRAYGYQLRDVDVTTIRKMSKFITNQVVDVLDLMSFEVDSDSDTLLLLYGNKAAMACEKAACLHKVEFPDASRLDSSLGETEERVEAFNILQNLKRVLDSGDLHALDTQTTETRTDKLSEQSIPNLTADQVRELERHQREQGKSHWEGITEDGRTIRVSVEPDDGAADISLTFAELFAVIGLKETFRVKELEIVYKPSRGNTTK
jgi:hypothetical protein